MTPDRQRIGIFGGAFDPVHLGHVKITESFLQSNLIDRMLVIPTPASPHKDTQKQTQFSHRFKMLKLAFDSSEHVKVSDLESDLPSPSYTLRTIKYLQDKHPQNTYYLCIGEDSLATFHTWWNYEDILKRVPLIVARRPGVNSSDIKQDILERTLFVDHTELDISSTQIREKARSADKELKSLVPEVVAQYIFKHGFYAD